MNRLQGIHPAVSAVYFLSVLLVTMFTSNPILHALALLGGAAFCSVLESKKVFFKSLVFCFFLFVLTAFTNPLFSHNGVTPLFFLNGNPVTLEALLYGVDIAAMLIAVIYWFKCFNYIMTSDKLLFLLGKVSPKISLVISSALRFIPLLKTQASKIRAAQKAMGLYASSSLWDKLRASLRVYSALITWSLENAVDTGLSMKSRGWGLKGRTCFSLFRFTRGDAVFLAFIVLSDVVTVAFTAGGTMNFAFYPRISRLDFNIYALFASAAFGALSFLPFILEILESVKWTYYKSKI